MAAALVHAAVLMGVALRTTTAQQMAGGYTPAESNSTVPAAVVDAIHDELLAAGAKNATGVHTDHFVVCKYETQVVAGTNYRVTIASDSAACNDPEETASFTVFQPLPNSDEPITVTHDAANDNAPPPEDQDISVAPASEGEDGVVRRPSAHNVSATLDRMEKIVADSNFTIFARVNHALLAAEAGLEMPANEVLIFGNPAGGTPFMQAGPAFGIDAPGKAHAYEGEDGVVVLAYNAPSWLAARHGISAEVARNVQAMEGAFAGWSARAAGAQPL